jgi:hypothetical protein
MIRLMDLLTEVRRPGETWKTSTGFGAKNPDGDSRYFYGDTGESLAKRWASGENVSTDEESSPPKVQFDDNYTAQFKSARRNKSVVSYMLYHDSKLRQTVGSESMSTLREYCGSHYKSINHVLRGIETDNYLGIVTGDDQFRKIFAQAKPLIEQDPEYQSLNRDLVNAEDTYSTLSDAEYAKHDLTDPDYSWMDAMHTKLQPYRDEVNKLRARIRQVEDRHRNAVAEPLVRDFVRSRVEMIDRIFEKSSPIDEDIVVYRGVAGKDLIDLMKSNQGSEFVDEGFVSTSPDVFIAENFGVFEEDRATMEILVPVGSKVIHPNQHNATNQKDEEEVLLPRGSTFRVLDVTYSKEDDRHHIRLEHVPMSGG